MSIYDKSSLVLIPSGTKAGKVYSQKPVSGDGDFTFTRSSAATRVNADGNIEKETSNLLLQSNSFDTTWVSSNTTETGGQSGYDGSSDAWLLSKTSGYANLNQSVSASGVNTYSVYAKANTLNWIRIVGGSTSAFFDLNNGVVGSTDAGNIAKMTSIGSGWYRCEVAMNASTTIMRIYPADGDNDVSGSSGSIYIQDAQLNQGLIAQEVITTTTSAVYGGITDNVPRLDYTDSSCPSLKLEPQRSNLVNFSEYIDSYWNPFGNISITDNDSTSPEGLENATKISAAATTTASIGIQKGISVTANQLHTISFFAKKTDFRYIQLFHGSNQVTGNARTNFDIQEGVVAYEESGVVTASVEDYGSGWYRCIATMEALTSVLQAYIVVAPTADATRSPQISANAGDAYQLYGIQMEAGSYATSYIPTYGSSVTRVGDSCSATSVSDLIGQTEGTLLAEVSVDTNSVSSLLNRVVSVTDGTLSNRVLIVLNTDETFRFIVIGGGSTLANITTSASALNGFHKVALGYKANDYVAYVDGVQVGSNTTAASVPSSLSQAFLGSVETGATSSVLEGSVKKSLMFKTRLTNTELADLTTL